MWRTRRPTILFTSLANWTQSCMTEDQKYQGALYKEKNNNKRAKTQNTPNHQRNGQTNAMAQPAYVEDVDETWKEYQGQTEDERSPAEPLPEAPTPPAAADEDNVNVFDFLVATGQTPNASNLNLAHPEADESKSLVRYEYNSDEYLDPSALMDEEALVQYGTGPYETPAPSKSVRRKKDADAKSDKKRKRLHVEVPGDEVMTDAPPVLHSGLTGGLKGLMRPTLPPSPDYSGADVAEPSPASPLKKTKHSKHSKNGQVSNSIFGMIAGNSKTKTKKRKTSKKSSSRHQEKSSKLIEYRSKDGKDGKDSEGGEMIVYKPRADLFFDFVNKGPESERGCSMNKALKRFHRERQAAGSDLSKNMEEKELWRSIRLRRNDRGEIVLFSI